MIVDGILIAIATLAVGLGAAYVLRLLPTIRLQLAGLALLAVVLPLGTVLASGWVMFDMHADVKVLSVSAAAACSAVFAALLLGHWIVAPVERLRAASAELASGDLSSRAPEAGPAELAQLGSSFNSMAGSLESLFDARRQLVAWASHDLRTPLASMQAMIEALTDGIGEPDEYLPALDQQVRLLATIVDDLFELARIDAGALTVQLEDTDLSELIASCVRGIEPEARARQIRLETEIEPGLGSVLGAPEKIERVLSNLLANALRHTPASGSITIAARPRGSHTLVAVEDTGPGIRPEDTTRVFDRFWRADRARSSAGSGLGLAIAKGLIDAQGGTIWAEKRTSGGACIAFTLTTAHPS
ncbi:MAG TPA: ATP-binding protein [Gaiellaceae bacterium]|nr:ATP-binding protein [Gaiellaceae bacterium]